jgi:hypothetical protein
MAQAAAGRLSIGPASRPEMFGSARSEAFGGVPYWDKEGGVLARLSGFGICYNGIRWRA